MVDPVMEFLRAHAWVLEVFAMVFATAVAHFLCRLLMRRLERHMDTTRNVYDDALVEAANGPLGWAVWLVGISAAAQLVGDTGDAEIFQYVAVIREVGIILLLAWFAVRFIRGVEQRISGRSLGDKTVDRTTANAVGKLLRASVIITAALMTLQGLGFSVSGVLAFGGIGGIAVGFAARDLLANFFGAFMVFLDRPFSVGDWIRSPDQEIEGTVEEIGWRLTRIRTFDQRPLYVPNAVFTSVTVENPSRMLNRRIYETIGVRYDDIEALPRIVAEVETLLQNHPDIDQSRTLMVNFVGFGSSSLDFMVYAFTRTTVWAEYHKIKQEILFRMADIISGHEAEIAFPTRTLHVVGPEAGPEAEPVDDADPPSASVER